MLCYLALAPLLPSRSLVISTFAAPVERSQIPHILALLLVQGDRIALQSRHVGAVAALLTGPGDVDIHVAAVAFLSVVACRHPLVFSSDLLMRMEESMGRDMRNVQLNGGRGGGKTTLVEIDGSKCRDFVTVLNLGKSYPPEQVLSM